MTPLSVLVLALAACGGEDTGQTPDDTGSDTASDSGATTDTPADLDDDGYPDPEDCDDTDPEVHPDATEVCNGIDDDCDGDVDDDDDSLDPTSTSAWHDDADADGYGDPATERTSCEPALDSVADGTDCDDGDPAVHPDAEETCDGLDEDCDGQVDETCAAAPTGTVALDGSGDSLVGDVAWGNPGGSIATLRDWDGDGLPDIAAGVHVVPGPVVGTVGLSSAVLVFEGGGSSTERAGDTNGDGLDGVLFGVHQEDYAYLVEGALSGTLATEDATATFYGDGTAWRSGRYFSTAGDMNDDGLDDILFGAPGDGWGYGYEGSVFGWFGPATGVLDPDHADVTLPGPTGWGGFGTAIEGPGDLDGDGYDDVVVGGGYWGAGNIYVLHGPITGDVVLSPNHEPRIDTEVGCIVLSYGAANRSLSVGPDTNGDGYADLLAGETDDTPAGLARLFLGPLTGAIPCTSADAVLEGVNEHDRAGLSTALPGDMDLDGHADLAVGAYNHDPSGVEDAGVVYLVYGPVTGTVGLETADAVFEGTSEEAWAGYALAGGDADGDAYADLLIGVLGETLGDTVKGLAVLVHGGP